MTRPERGAPGWSMSGSAELHGVERHFSRPKPRHQLEFRARSALRRIKHVVGALAGHDHRAVSVENDDIARLDRDPADLDGHIDLPLLVLHRTRRTHGASPDGETESDELVGVSYRAVDENPGGTTDTRLKDENLADESRVTRSGRRQHDDLAWLDRRQQPVHGQVVVRAAERCARRPGRPTAVDHAQQRAPYEADPTCRLIDRGDPELGETPIALHVSAALPVADAAVGVEDPLQ
jgi:hypothetical protein